MGAGWNELEHESFGFAFPPLRERLEHLAEQIEIVHRLWTEEHVTFEGKHYHLVDCPALPKPVQDPHPPLIVGGRAKPGTAIPAARFADEYNVIGASLEDYVAARKALDEACEREGRDPKTLRMSIMTGVLLGADEDDLLDKARASMERWGSEMSPEEAVERARARGTAGTPEQLIEGLGRLEEVGVERVMLQHIRHEDLETVELLGREVVAKLRYVRAALASRRLPARRSTRSRRCRRPALPRTHDAASIKSQPTLAPTRWNAHRQVQAGRDVRKRPRARESRLGTSTSRRPPTIGAARSPTDRRSAGDGHAIASSRREPRFVDPPALRRHGQSRCPSSPGRETARSPPRTIRLPTVCARRAFRQLRRRVEPTLVDADELPRPSSTSAVERSAASDHGDASRFAVPSAERLDAKLRPPDLRGASGATMPLAGALEARRPPRNAKSTTHVTALCPSIVPVSATRADAAAPGDRVSHGEPLAQARPGASRRPTRAGRGSR